MCIIIAKPSDVEMPDYSTIERCWKSNPDGAGFMFPKNGLVRISKGYMDFQNLVFALEDLGGENELKELPLVLHFRIATHGSVIPGNCHPFPVRSNVKRMYKLEDETDIAVAHNGVISGVATSDKVSDTMSFISQYVAPLRSNGVLFEKWAQELLGRSCNGSRLAILDRKGAIHLIGAWSEENGVYYSNDGYKPFTGLHYPRTASRSYYKMCSSAREALSMQNFEETYEIA